MIDQPHLPTLAPSPTQADRDLPAILAALDGAGWRKSDHLLQATGIPARRVRACAERSGGRIISCAARGYHLTSQATPDDFRHACADLRSRAQKLITRLGATISAWHATTHPRT
jgi:hypothetical protein